MITERESGGSGSISTAEIRRAHLAAPRCTGLALPAFDDDFDLFFEVKSDFIDRALDGDAPNRHAAERCKSIPDCKRSPPHWGTKVDTLSLFWQYVQADAQGYAASHYIDEKFNHVCLSSPCEWHHHDQSVVVAKEEAVGKTMAMKVNMHLINCRYIKPWTKQFPDAHVGLALVMNTARLCDRSGPSAEDICKATIFISHCWDELSLAFFGTLERDFDAESVVWVCSFALDQNGHISEALKNVEQTPFFLALKAADSVTAITDATCEVFDRVWCVLEAHLALAMGKSFSLVLWEDEDHEVWHDAAGKLANIDVHECKATVQSDKDLILEYCNQNLDEVNKNIHEISRKAVLQAEIRSFAKDGNLVELSKRLSLDEMRQFKTGKRQRTLTHLFAEYRHVAEMLEFSEKIDHTQLHFEDVDRRTPLSLACEGGDVATVSALLTQRAGVDVVSVHGLTPLHYAAECGHRPIVHLLKHAGADIHALGTFKNEVDHSPMSIAVSRDAPEIVRDFLDWRCDGNFAVEGLPILHRASQAGHARIVAALLASKVDVNSRSSEGRTALIHAATNGHASVVVVLRAMGADATLTDNDGRTVKASVEECRHDHPLEADDIEFFLKVGLVSSLDRSTRAAPDKSNHGEVTSATPVVPNIGKVIETVVVQQPTMARALSEGFSTGRFPARSGADISNHVEATSSTPVVPKIGRCIETAVVQQPTMARPLSEVVSAGPFPARAAVDISDHVELTPATPVVPNIGKVFERVVVQQPTIARSFSEGCSTGRFPTRAGAGISNHVEAASATPVIPSIPQWAKIRKLVVTRQLSSLGRAVSEEPSPGPSLTFAAPSERGPFAERGAAAHATNTQKPVKYVAAELPQVTLSSIARSSVGVQSAQGGAASHCVVPPSLHHVSTRTPSFVQASSPPGSVRMATVLGYSGPNSPRRRSM